MITVTGVERLREKVDEVVRGCGPNPVVPISARTDPGELYTSLSAIEYAAIQLRDPNSGTPWLDAMISRTLDREQDKADQSRKLTDALIDISRAMRPNTMGL